MAIVMENRAPSASNPNITPTDDYQIQDEDSTTSTLSDRVGAPNRLYSLWRDANGDGAVAGLEDDVYSQTSDPAENYNRIPLTPSQVTAIMKNKMVLGYTVQD